MPIPKEVISLCNNWFKPETPDIKQLPLSGSNRSYFRALTDSKSVIAVYNTDVAENEAFYYLRNKLADAGVKVPEVYTKADTYYLQEDLGDVTLFDFLQNDPLGASSTDVYQKYLDVIREMPKIQFEASKDLKYSVCYPREAFDRRSIQWDLNYFKYFFLKTTYIPFHEEKLEDDFQVLIDHLLSASNNFFLFRDFQSRNIMIKNDEIYFIDFQGGRRGALQYDLASLLFEAKTNLSTEMRRDLLEKYLTEFEKYSFFNRTEFLKYYPAFALIRILQAFGAYGYRGIFEQKAHFVQSIAPGIENLKWLLSEFDPGIEIPHLKSVIQLMSDLKDSFSPSNNSLGLTVSINSFSYKKGIPKDYSGNGGGFVFDCRALPNPGRYAEYRQFTGRDEKVKDFLEPLPEVSEFKDSVRSLVEKSVKRYLERGFDNLQVSFGCTGGQHRSVFMAEKLCDYLSINFPVNIRLTHRELKIEKEYGKNDVQKE